MEETKDLVDGVTEVNQSASSSKDLSKSLPEEAFNNFLQGKRHMLVRDYTFAVQSLATACELYCQHFGELALECAEVYFLYGKALFRLSQQQSGVLANVPKDDSNDDEEEKSSEESKENGSEQNASDTEGAEENQEGDEENQEGDEENQKEGDVKEDSNDENEEEKEPSESTDSPEAPLGEGNEDPKETEAEEKSKAETSEQNESNVDEQQQEAEEDDLELAWNTLETAKSIFKRQGEHNVEAQLKVVEILQLLAEISMESDNNAAAIIDLKECLSIQERHLQPDDRLLAETYYQMGLAQMLDKQYREALNNFKTTMRILELRIVNLKKKPIPDTVGSFESADQAIEISELEGILHDIREKIEDTEELIRNTKKDMEEEILRRSLNFSSALEKREFSSKPVSNITHLLKRKKPEDENTESESKRIKTSSSIPNGETGQ